MKFAVLVFALFVVQTLSFCEAQEKAPRPASPAVKVPFDGSLMRFVPDEACMILGVKPGEILRSRLTTEIVRRSGNQAPLSVVAHDLMDKTGINLTEVEEVIIFADELEIKRIELVRRRLDTRQRMKHLGLAAHNFLDNTDSFPMTAEMTNQTSGKLSWRVFLLPYLGYEDLFYQFDLNAAWDAPQNKRLLDLMPAVFISDGVSAPGHTSMRMLGGEGTPSGGTAPVKYRDITDGTDRTILFVQAGPDKAQPWTQPELLEINPDDPLGSLGNVGASFCCCMMDGGVFPIGKDVGDEAFVSLARHKDGLPISWSHEALWAQHRRVEWPGILLRSSKPLDQNAVAAAIASRFGKPSLTADGQQTTYDFANQELWFPDARTMAFVSFEMANRLASRSVGSRAETLKSQFERLFEKSQFAGIGSEVAIRNEAIPIAASGRLPDLRRKAKGSLFAVNWVDPAKEFAMLSIQTEDRKSALQWESMFEGFVSVARAMALEALPDSADVAPGDVDSTAELLDRIQVLCEGTTVRVHVPPIGEVDTLAKTVAPAFSKMISARLATLELERLKDEHDQLRRLSLALQLYLDEFKGCPPASTPGAKLSWRVALLPYLDQQELFDQFHLDEAWDSPHNRQLIPKMPVVFSSRRISAPGKTSVHVSDDADSPFNSNSPASDSDLFSNRELCLFFLAAPETADIWTKPGGLHFSSRAPATVLGSSGSQWRAVRIDSSIFEIESQIDTDSMMKLITVTKTQKPRPARISKKEEAEFEQFLESQR